MQKSNMTQQERLQTMEALWDAITHDQSEPPSPSWHEAILAARRAKMEEGSAEYVGLDELKSRTHK
jgi:hypothetical protein